MKKLSIILFMLIGILTGCNNHSEEDIFTPLRIVTELEPQSSVIDWGNMTSEERRKYPRKGFVINSVDDFPNEPNINMDDLKLMGIDFSQYTLIVNYFLVPGYIKSHHYFWYYDNVDNQFIFQSDFNIVDPDNDPSQKFDLFTYYRAAIIVAKIPSDKKVTFTSSY